MAHFEWRLKERGDCLLWEIQLMGRESLELNEFSAEPRALVELVVDIWLLSLEKGMATHSSSLAWRIPWTEEPGGLQSTQLSMHASIGYPQSIESYTHAWIRIFLNPERYTACQRNGWEWSWVSNYVAPEEKEDLIHLEGVEVRGESDTLMQRNSGRVRLWNSYWMPFFSWGS